MLDMEQAADMEADKKEDDSNNDKLPLTSISYDVGDGLNSDKKWYFKDSTVTRIVGKHLDRAERSNKKYDNTINNVEKPLGKWAAEALDESLDQSVYIQRLLETIAEVTIHIEDLGWEAQRMSSSGRETLKTLWEYFEIPWDDSIDKGESYG